MDEIKVLLHAILERLDVQGAHIEQMKLDIARLQGDIKQIKEDIAMLKEDVAMLKEDVAVLKRDVAALKEGQVRQEKILERLSIRSIEHEVQIEELCKAVTA